MDEELHILKRRLPHWSISGATYLTTWCLKEGVSLLSSDERTVVESAILHFNDIRYKLLGYVVMDDHVHVIVRPQQENPLGKLVHSWKSFTANKINKSRNTSGGLWQADRFDRVIRSESELMQKMEYVVTNPVRRWPDAQEYSWVRWFSDE